MSAPNSPNDSANDSAHDTAGQPSPDSPQYPSGTVRALLNSPLVTPATRRALQQRLDDAVHDRSYEPRFLNRNAYDTLRAIVARLIPHAERATPVPIASAIDARLADGRGKGWRYAELPPDEEAYAVALRGFDELAASVHGMRFTSLSAAQQGDVLQQVQKGDARTDAWTKVPAARFFEELLSECVELYYSDPITQEELGYTGMADRLGYQHIALDGYEPHEPRRVG